MKNVVDINALVARCCWKASSGNMEGESFLEECIALKEGMSKMKENYMNLLSDIDHLLMYEEEDYEETTCSTSYILCRDDVDDLFPPSYNESFW